MHLGTRGKYNCTNFHFQRQLAEIFKLYLLYHYVSIYCVANSASKLGRYCKNGTRTTSLFRHDLKWIRAFYKGSSFFIERTCVLSTRFYIQRLLNCKHDGSSTCMQKVSAYSDRLLYQFFSCFLSRCYMLAETSSVYILGFGLVLLSHTHVTQ